LNGAVLMVCHSMLIEWAVSFFGFDFYQSPLALALMLWRSLSS